VAEIGNLGVQSRLVKDEYVLRLYVAVDDAALMERREATGDMECNIFLG
jgi:hypothetical protein